MRTCFDGLVVIESIIAKAVGHGESLGGEGGGRGRLVLCSALVCW